MIVFLFVLMVLLSGYIMKETVRHLNSLNRDVSINNFDDDNDNLNDVKVKYLKGKR